MMKRKTIVLLAILSVTIAAHGQSKRSDLYDFKIRKLKDNIYLAYRPEPLRLFVEGNVTIIINEHDVVVIDAGGSPRSARNVIAEIKKLTPNPVRYLINTHVHRDHRFGNQEFVRAFPGVEIIAHPGVREIVAGGGSNPNYMADTIKRIEAQQREKGAAEIERLRKEGKHGNEQVIAHLKRYYNQDIYTILEETRKVVNTPPTLTFEKKMVLYGGQRTIEILFLGHGDTPQDVVVYLPQDKLVCTGDMVVHPVPYGFSDEPLEWLSTLGRLSELDFDTLVPGHGEAQTGKAYLRSLMRLLGSVQEQVKAGVAAGLDMEGVRKRVDLSVFEKEFAGDNPVYRYYFRAYFSDPNIERTFKKLKAGTGRE